MLAGESVKVNSNSNFGLAEKLAVRKSGRQSCLIKISNSRS